MAKPTALIEIYNTADYNAILPGEFGIVYKALLKASYTKRYTETVAVKTLKGTEHCSLHLLLTNLGCYLRFSCCILNIRIF